MRVWRVQINENAEASGRGSLCSPADIRRGGSVIDIDMKRSLAPFKRRLCWEAVLKSVLAAGIAVLPVWLAAVVLRRLTGAAFVTPAAMLGAWLTLALILFAVHFHPTDKAVAARLDALGLKDRTSAMVEFAKEDGVLYRLQREDAVRSLERVSPEMLKLRISKVQAAICLVLAMLVGAASLVPDEVIALIPGIVPQESEEVILLREKIEELRDVVEGSELQEADKVRLLAQLDVMMEQTKAGRMEISALQEVRRLMDVMNSTVVELTPRDTYAAAMLEYESLETLGEAIFKGNLDVVTLVFDGFAYQLTQVKDAEQVSALMDLVYDINGSLAKPIRDDSQETIRQAMMALAGGLEMAAEMVYSHRDNTQMIERSLYYAEESIREFLGADQPQEERYDPFAKTPEELAAMPQKRYSSAPPVQIVTVLSPTETEHVYDPPDSVFMGSYKPGAADDQGGVQRILAPKDEAQDGTVPYGEVYGTYYAGYLKAKGEEAIPEGLEELAEAYFNGI